MTCDAIKDRLIQIIAVALGTEPSVVDPTLSFDAMGLDSMAKVSIIPSLEQHFGCQLDGELLFDCSNLDELSAHIKLILDAK